MSDDVHEVERALSLVATLGYRLPPGDDGRLRVHRPAAGRPSPVPWVRYVVTHPGASAPARAWSPAQCAALVGALAAVLTAVDTRRRHGHRPAGARRAGHRRVLPRAPAVPVLTRRTGLT